MIRMSAGTFYPDLISTISPLTSIVEVDVTFFMRTDILNQNALEGED